MGNLLKLLGVGLFIAFILLAGPALFIWAINTLVQAGGAAAFSIPFTFWTWLAALILGGLGLIGKIRGG